MATLAGSQADVDTATAAMVTAQLQAQFTAQQRMNSLNQLLGNPDLPLEQFPAYRQAQAVLDQAKRDLDHTVLRAPIAGTATQVDSIQLGRFVMAGAPVFSIIDDSAPGSMPIRRKPTSPICASARRRPSTSTVSPTTPSAARWWR